MPNERFMKQHYGASGFVDRTEATADSPIYHKVEEDKGGATKTYMIVCNEGWRESIVCCSMYDWVADWLLSIVQSRPFAPEVRPGATDTEEREL